jgi:hypothetical protein
MQGRVRALDEKLNGWLKNWGILSQVFRHHIMMHGDVLTMATGDDDNDVDGDGVTGNERGGGL